MNKETRTFSNDIEVRVNDSGQEVISGYAIVFGEPSRDLGGFIEYIDRRAMDTADITDVVALFNHDQNMILGRTPATLTLTTDERGVRYDIVPPDTTAARDLKVSIARGDVRGSSFGFTVNENGDAWEKPKEKGQPWTRTITGFKKIWDVSPVVTPAYVQTDASIAKRTLGVLKDEEERKATEAIELERAKAEMEQKKEEQQREITKIEVDAMDKTMTEIFNKYQKEE